MKQINIFILSAFLASALMQVSCGEIEIIADTKQVALEKELRGPKYKPPSKSSPKAATNFVVKTAPPSKPIFPKQQIFQAADKGDLNKVKQILSANKNQVNMKRSSDGQTVLHIAATRNNIQMITYLNKQGASKTAQDNQGDTPLHIAAKNGSEPAARYLSSASALEIRNKEGDTPERSALKFKNYKVSHYLRSEYGSYNLK